MIKQHRSNIYLALFLGLSLLLIAFKSHLWTPDTGEALAQTATIDVRAVAVPLNSEKPDQTRVGGLVYLGGWALSSSHERFGGLSGLVVKDGEQLVAISDQGDWFTARFDPTSKSPILDASLHPFQPGMTEDSKIDFDAESLISAGDDFLVSFEHRHRLLLARPDGTNRPWKNGHHIDFSAVADNSGLEAIVWASDNRLLTFTERGVDSLGRLRAWLVGDTGADLLYFKPPVNFSPTDAARLPDGDFLVLARSFSIADGVKVKLLRVKASDVRPGETFEGEELAHLEPPLAVDNLEGLDVGVSAGGKTIIYMISDDNFRASQRTLLLTFALDQ